MGENHLVVVDCRGGDVEVKRKEARDGHGRRFLKGREEMVGEFVLEQSVIFNLSSFLKIFEFDRTS
jgi:hypothetical protein